MLQFCPKTATLGTVPDVKKTAQELDGLWAI